MAAVADFFYIFFPCWFISFALRSFLLTCFSVFDFFRCRCYKDEAAPTCIPLFCESVCLSSVVAFAIWLWALKGWARTRKYVIARSLFLARSSSILGFSQASLNHIPLNFFLTFIFCTAYCPFVYRCSLFHHFYVSCMWKRIFKFFHDFACCLFVNMGLRFIFHMDSWPDSETSSCPLSFMCIFAASSTESAFDDECKCGSLMERD